MKQLLKHLKTIPKYFIKKKFSFSFLSLSKVLFYAFIAMLPFQIDIVSYTSPIFESGHFNPFTSVFIYLTDFLFVLAFISWGIAIFRHEYKEKITHGNPIIFILLFLFLITAEISVLFATDKWLSFNIVIRFVELSLMYFFVINKVVKLNTLINVFIVTVSFQALLAILQYIFQGSLGLHFLGEPHISADTYGVAKIALQDSVVVRPYGTFPHTNILAGFLLTSILFTYHFVRQKEYIAYPLLFLQLGAFILTFSRGAFLGLLIAFLVYISLRENKISFKYLFFFLAILLFFVVVFNLEQTILNRIIFSDLSAITDRVFYFNISKAIIYAFPFGIGLGNFTLLMQDFTRMKLSPWEFQPVHNTYMLIINEIGIIGFIVFIFLLISFGILIFMSYKKAKEKSSRHLGTILVSLLAGIFVIGLFDHFLITLYHGQVLTFLLFAIYGRFILLKTH